MLRRIVLVVVIVAAAGLVALLSKSEEGAGGAGAVLRREARDASAPAFATDGPESAVPAGAAVQSAAASADDGTLRITVLHSDGVPAVGCLVIAEPNQGSPWSARADATGTATGPSLPSAGGAWIDGVMPGPQSFKLSATRG